MVSSSYRSAMESWIGDAQRVYGSRFSPYAQMLKAAAKSGEVTDQQLYKMACDAKGEIEKPKAAPAAAQNDFMHWELVQYPDGAVYCFNPNNGKIYAALRPGTRGFSYVGPSSFLSKLGGRGEISQLVSMLEDGDYLHTREKKR